MPFLDETRSLFLFKQDNALRVAMLKLINSKVFFVFILAVIGLNSIVLAANQPKYPAPSSWESILYWVEVAFISIYGLEMVAKVIALGFALHPEAYLRDPWNVFDALIILVSILALTMNFDNITALRTFRVLRPLRTVSHIKRLKMLLNALLMSIPAVTTNFLFLVYFIFVMALFGLNVWSGEFSKRCYYPPGNPWVQNGTSATIPPGALPQLVEGNTNNIPFVPSPPNTTGYPVQVSANFSMGAVVVPTPAPFDTSYNWDLAENFTVEQYLLGNPDVNEKPCSIDFNACPHNGTCYINTTQFRAGPFSFDTIGTTMLLVFKSAILDNWNDEMNDAVAASGYPIIAYFIVITLFAGYFLINVFLAILMSEYNLVVIRIRQKKYAKEKERRRREERKAVAAARNAGPAVDEFGVADVDDVTEVVPFNNGANADGNHDMITENLQHELDLAGHAQGDDDEETFLRGPAHASSLSPAASPGASPKGSRAATPTQSQSVASSPKRQRHKRGSRRSSRAGTPKSGSQSLRGSRANTPTNSAHSPHGSPTSKSKRRAGWNDLNRSNRSGDGDDAWSKPSTRPNSFVVNYEEERRRQEQEREEEERRIEEEIREEERTKHVKLFIQQRQETGDLDDCIDIIDEAEIKPTIQKQLRNRLAAIRKKDTDSDDEGQDNAFLGATATVLNLTGNNALLSSDGDSSSSSSDDSDYFGLGTTGRLQRIRRKFGRRYDDSDSSDLSSTSYSSSSYDGDTTTPETTDSDEEGGSKNVSPQRKYRPPKKRVEENSLSDDDDKPPPPRGRRRSSLVSPLPMVIPGDPTLGDEAANVTGDDTPEWRKKFQGFVNAFAIFMFVVTIINVAVLAADHYQIDSTLEFWFDAISYGCTILFALEIILKVIAFGIIATFSDGFNVLDFLLVALAIFEFFFAFSGVGGAFTAFRALRAFRVLRLVRRIPSVQILVSSIAPSIIPALLVCLLLFIFIYIYAILGMQFFGAASFGVLRVSYGTIWEATLSNFIVVTGDQWGNILAAGVNINPVAAPIFFITLFAIGNFIILNLFAAVIIEQLDTITNIEWDKEQAEERLTLTNKEFPPRLILPPITAKVKEVIVNSPTAQITVGQQMGYKNHKQHSSGVFSAVRQVAAITVDSVSGQMFSFFTTAKRSIHKAYIIQGSAFFIFTPQNCLRDAIAKVFLSDAFRYFSIFVNVANIGMIAVQHPNDSDSMREIQLLAEMGFAGFYVFEVLMMMIARGVFVPRDATQKLSDGTKIAGVSEVEHVVTASYFSENSNILNFIIAISAVAGVWFPSLYPLRSIRALKLITFFPSLKITVIALLKAVPHMAVSFLLCGILWFVFAICGVQLLKGKLYYCTDPDVAEEPLCRGSFNNTARSFDSIPLFSQYSQFEGTYPREWKRYITNFDHVGHAMVSLLTVALGEDWPEVMFLGTDARTPGLGIRYYENPYMSLYFVIFVVIGNFLTFSLMLGVLINFFIRYKKGADGTMLLSPSQRLYLLTNRIVLATMFEREVTKPENCFRWVFHTITTATLRDMCPSLMGDNTGAGGTQQDMAPTTAEQKMAEAAQNLNHSSSDKATPKKQVMKKKNGAVASSKKKGGKQFASPKAGSAVKGSPDAKKVKRKTYSSGNGLLIIDDEPVFELLMSLITIANAVALALYSHEQTQEAEDATRVMHLIFICIFTTEFVFKLIAQSPFGYFSSHLNKIDFLATIAMILGLVFEEQLGRLAYIARIVRIFRTFKHFMNTGAAQKQFAVIIHGLPSLFNLVFLLFVLFFVFGVIGLDLFGNIKLQGSLDELNNFQYLSNSFLVLYTIMSTNNWHSFMIACLVEEPYCSSKKGDCGTLWAFPYFVGFVFISYVILLQLCVAIVVEHFEDIEDGAGHAVMKGMAELRGQWRDLAGNTSTNLPLDKLIVLLLRLPRKLTLLDSPVKPRTVFLLLFRMQIPLEEDLSISYESTVHSVVRYHFSINPAALEHAGLHDSAVLKTLPDAKHFCVGHLIAARIIWQRWKQHKAAQAVEKKAF